VLLVEPAYTRTSFDANSIPADEPLAVYARRREVLDALLAEAIRGGDEPSVVADAIVAAATGSRPKLRYPAGPLARRISKLRRYAPSTVFDKQIRKVNQLNGPAGSTAPAPGAEDRQSSAATAAAREVSRTAVAGRAAEGDIPQQ
jgi:hypothetical protein